MELNNIIVGDYNGTPIHITYVIDLPTTFDEHEFFKSNHGVVDGIINHLSLGKLLRPGEWRAFRSDDVRHGHVLIEGVYWECVAVYIPRLEHYHVIRFQSDKSRALAIDKTLFRLHSGGSVHASVKRAYEIRDVKELRNIIKAVGYVGDVLEVKPYGFDARINWAAYLVTLDGNAIGYTNSPVYIGEE